MRDAIALLERLLAIDGGGLRAALDQAAGAVAEALAADKIDVLLHEAETASLVALGISDTPMGRHQRELGLDRAPLANGGRAVGVYLTGEPFRDGRVEADPEELRGIAGALGVRSQIMAPLEVGGERQGVLQAFSATPDFFGPDDLRVLTAAARWVGVLAHRAELVERAARWGAERAERAGREEVLAHQAFHDPLTGLPNRALFLDRLGHALGPTGGADRPVAVLFVDLDRLKEVNDAYGHAAGDRALVEAVGRLQGCFRPADTVARLAGDEFAALVPEVDDAEARRVAERVVAALEPPLPVGERYPVHVPASVGVALGWPGRDRPEAVLRDADRAMYRAKRAGGGRSAVYAPGEAAAAADAAQRLEGELRLGLERDELRLHYQPKVALASGRVVGLEALVRWQHPERGLLPPAAFVGLAEETGLIGPLGEWVLAEACRRAKGWQERYPTAPPVVSANLSARELRRPDLVVSVAAHLAEVGLEPGGLRLEITETAALDAGGAPVATLGELRRLGVRLELDDFGTGYGSLTYLRRLPLDALKVDRSFVGGLDTDPTDTAIVESVVGLSRVMGLETQAEGVETPEQAARLREMRCEVGQGFLWAPPLPAEAADAFLAQHLA